MRLINIEDEPLLKTVSVGGLSAKALWRLIKNQRTIKAVPIEWIKSKKIEYEHDRYDYCKGCFDGFNDCIDYLISEWEEENEVNRR